MKSNAQNILKRFWDVIQNANLQNITSQNLFTAAGITQREFEDASNILTNEQT
jgi:hypothetical protein